MKSVFVLQGEQGDYFGGAFQELEDRAVDKVVYWNVDDRDCPRKLQGWYVVNNLNRPEAPHHGCIGWRLDKYTADDPDDRVAMVMFRLTGELP